MDLAELESAYWDHIAPAIATEGHDPQSHRPTHEWLSANGFRGLVYALREYHDTTFAEFWNDVLDLQSQGYDWEIDHEPTINSLERYLDRQQSRLSWAEGTARTHRYRLARYVRAYAGVNGTADILSPIDPNGDIDESAAVDACWATFDALDQRVSRTTLQRIYETTADFYESLLNRREAKLNPTDGLDYDWTDDADDDTGSSENPPLAPEHVRALFDAATTTREQLIVVGLCAWGLRSGEVASLHASQLVLDEENPRIEFDERKNGPGSVAVIYGADVARDRLTELADRNDWNGYLFPSDRSETGHRRRGTILRWFEDLAGQAELPETIDGHKPVPQMGRRFWYDRYTSTIEDLVEEHIDEIASDQGSASAQVVMDDYLSPERKRELRRQFMREKLADAFEGVQDGR
ncbi:site-specific integrase [Halorhabdus amylolytica]|uniref:site-specific integrase n=1 Tax=Halorhabdus amylolytica TaxID=2559573 RepID=UPI0010A9B8E6|nr:site-specific integrase [Halorhabdus amylolytica]